MLTRSACKREAAGLTQVREGSPGHRQSLRERTSAVAPKVGEEHFAGEVAANCPARAEQHQFAQASGRRTRPRPALLVSHRYGEPAQHLDQQPTTCRAGASGASGVTVQLCQVRSGKTSGRGLP